MHLQPAAAPGTAAQQKVRGDVEETVAQLGEQPKRLQERVDGRSNASGHAINHVWLLECRHARTSSNAQQPSS
eukprot:2635109-Prorocentrum_lima.AAC.1